MKQARVIEHDVRDGIGPVGEGRHFEQLAADGAVQIGHQHHTHLALREALGIDQDVADQGLLFGAAAGADRLADQGCCDGVLKIDLARYRDRLTATDGVKIGHLIDASDEGGQLDARSRADTGLQCALQQLRIILKLLQRAVSELPGTWRRKGDRIMGGVEVE